MSLLSRLSTDDNPVMLVVGVISCILSSWQVVAVRSFSNKLTRLVELLLLLLLFTVLLWIRCDDEVSTASVTSETC